MADEPTKTPTKQQLFEKVLDNDQARQKAVNKLERELAKLYEGYFARVKSTVQSDLSKTGAMTLQAATKVIEQLEGILLEAGFDDVVGTFHDQFETLAGIAVRYYEPFGLEPSLAGVSREDMTAWVDARTIDLGKTLSRSLIDPIQTGLLQANFGNMERDAVIDQVLAIEPTLSARQATVLVDDSFAGFQRGVIAQKADSLGMEIYQYLGPLDAITSDQCEAMLLVNRHGVPGMLYKDEINVSLHPDLRRDPLIGGGHFNCRHSWSPVTEAYAIEKGFRPR